ncbi:hypothetical protein BDY24DRAFT_417091 [Mrakia frigida]|uniref:uncharacterized protein n=1 Tax=Mrakia frigida TaxID=29902 RepID=UPI003FCBEF9E
MTKTDLAIHRFYALAVMNIERQYVDLAVSACKLLHSCINRIGSDLEIPAVSDPEDARAEAVPEEGLAVFNKTGLQVLEATPELEEVYVGRGSDRGHPVNAESPPSIDGSDDGSLDDFLALDHSSLSGDEDRWLDDAEFDFWGLGSTDLLPVPDILPGLLNANMDCSWNNLPSSIGSRIPVEHATSSDDKSMNSFIISDSSPVEIVAAAGSVNDGDWETMSLKADTGPMEAAPPLGISSPSSLNVSSLPNPLPMLSEEQRKAVEVEVGQELFGIFIGPDGQVIESNQVDDYQYRPTELEAESLYFFTARFKLVPRPKKVPSAVALTKTNLRRNRLFLFQPGHPRFATHSVRACTLITYPVLEGAAVPSSQNENPTKKLQYMRPLLLLFKPFRSAPDL